MISKSLINSGALALLAAFILLATPIMGVELEDPLVKPITKGGPIIRLEPVADGMTAPNWGTFAPGDARRLFVVDQIGVLWAVNLFTGDKEVFADLSGLLVALGVGGPGTFDERGFIGLAFHPNYQSNGLLYTYTSEPVSGTPDFLVPLGAPANHHTVISEWQVPEPGNTDSVVDPTSRRVLMSIGEPQFNHNAGALNFGPDGLLYIAVGDGGAGDDQGAGHSAQGNGQDRSNILGNILRIDPHGSNSANGQYGVPKYNPFFPDGVEPFGGEVGCADGVCDEIFAWGFRNPFRVSFDSATGVMYAADVGQNDIEEVHIVMAGGNYGWPVKEGSFCFDPNGAERGFVTDDDPCPNEPGMLIDPVAEYDHDEGIAVVGGFVYRGSMLPKLRGHYVFGDFSRNFGGNNGRLFFLNKKDLVKNNQFKKRHHKNHHGKNHHYKNYRGKNHHYKNYHHKHNRVKTSEITEFMITGQDGLGMSLLGFGQDARGELYVLANTTGVPSGETGVVMKISPLNPNLSMKFYTRLSGAEQTIPVDTPAYGNAFFKLNHDGTKLKFSVDMKKIENVIGVHIHLAPLGENGPIALSIVPNTAGFLTGGPFVAEPLNEKRFRVRGVAMADDLVGPLTGMPLAVLIDEIRNDNAYINVHTVENRGGEIRGQIQR